MEDKYLLNSYMLGFNDELRGEVTFITSNVMSKVAYLLGREDAIVGDDVRSVDYQSDEEVLNRIKNVYEGN